MRPLPAPIQQALDAAIARGASEQEQALIWAGRTQTPMEGTMPSGRPWPALTNTRAPSRADMAVYVKCYRRWQLEAATEPDRLKRDLALLYRADEEAMA